MNHFFVSCQIDQEDELIFEIESFWHRLIDLDGLPTRSRPPEMKKDQGGVEFKCPAYLGYQINLFSKLANKVLMRIYQFQARYFDQFEKELKKINLKTYFEENPFSIRLESSKSRLFHEGNLTEVVKKYFPKCQIDSSLESSSESTHLINTVYFRIFKDEVVISVDTTGRHLHKRGYRLQQGVAPIRESLAAQMVQFLLKESRYSKFVFNDMNKNQILLDPMCGAGTLLFEASIFHLPLLKSPFSFELFSQRHPFFGTDVWKKNYPAFLPTMTRYLGIEKDLNTYEKALQNLKKLNQLYSVEESQFEFISEDCSQYIPNPSESELNQETFLIINPPYGTRLDSEDSVQKILSLEDKWPIVGAVIVHPVQWKWNWKKLKLIRQKPFENQGLRLTLSYFGYPL